MARGIELVAVNANKKIKNDTNDSRIFSENKKGNNSE